MTRKSRKLRSSFYEVNYCGERLQACRFAPSEQWFWFSAVIMVAVDQGIHFSGTFCHWHEGQFPKL